MIITKPHSKDETIEGIFRGHWFQAIVEDEPSPFGIRDGRVTELFLSENAEKPLELDSSLSPYHWKDGQIHSSLIRMFKEEVVVEDLVLELEKLPLLTSIPETPDIQKMVKNYINRSPFSGLYKEGCCCWGDRIMECQKVINTDISMCRAGYKHKSQLDGVTIKPYPPRR